ncbi:MAG: class II aldolase/adducin family protein [Treponema sp.]|jgi:rhamnose utilization protein RhaD (predicted bifunctional aldolase and dehydrogenase)|nr:class II aldolase/adducin family protein [Treponema sp.]
MTDNELELGEICALSNRYGRDSNYVIAGGGNTSYKNDDTLWIKGSGVSLAEITKDGFVAMDRAKLAAVWDKAKRGMYPDAPEAAVLAEMMAAKKPGQEDKRPSVETLLHDMLPFTYVVHTHPALINGMCCGKNGEKTAASLFGAGALWIPASDPGFVLAAAVQKKLEGAQRIPSILLLQNHGIFAAANDSRGIDAIYRDVSAALAEKIIKTAAFGPPLTEYRESETIGASLARAASAEAASPRSASFVRNDEYARLVSDRAVFEAAAVPFTPDHIVYAGSDPLFIERGKDIAEAFNKHCASRGRAPKIAAYQGLGIFGIGVNKKSAVTALELFDDWIKVGIYAESFGGPLPMSREKIDFINNWEAEHYRAKLNEQKQQ